MNAKDSTNQPIVFQFSKADVRIQTDEHGQPWFCAKDVCAVLDIVWKGAESIESLEDHWKGVRSEGTVQGVKNLLYVTEPGLYKLIFRSSKPEAVKFANWVCEEVLPALRKRGHFGTLELKDRLAISRHVKGLMKDLIKMDDAFGYELLSNEINDLMSLAGLPRPDIEKLGISRKGAH